MIRETASLTRAITDHLIIEMWYEPGPRRLEPYCLGRSAKGNLLLRAFQISGASQSGEPEHWKLLRVDRFRQLVVTDSRFDPFRPEYRMGDKAMRGGIITQVEI